MNHEQIDPAELLSGLTVYSKYARWWPELGRRETYPEIVARNRQMHLDHFGKARPELRGLIDWSYRLVLDRKVFPSMRSFQFGGEAIHRAHNRIYNCAYMSASDPAFFRELMFLLLGGTGVGYSVQQHHVEQLPEIQEIPGSYFHAIEDTIEGWADAVDALLGAFLNGTYLPMFDYGLIRPKGAILKTSGGRAPGPEPLEECLEKIGDVLWNKPVGSKLTTLEVHDIACHIARAVLSGGIRRSAMISLFTPTDELMLHAKDSGFWNENPDRAYANNSAVLRRGIDDDLFFDVFAHTQAEGTGEPGVYWVDDLRYGTNPCAEVALNDMQFCNLTTMNAGTIESQQDFNDRARAAAIIGTLQASYTNFHYLRPEWRTTTEAEALIGVSMTGIASGAIDGLDASEAASHAVAANKEVAELLGINQAARVTVVKPEGTASLVAGTSSGIHAWHDEYYVRRIRYNKEEPIAKYLMSKLPLSAEVQPVPELLEQDATDPNSIVLAIPQRAPEGARTRDEGPFELAERVKRYHREWIRPGNTYGGMANNISATLNIRPSEWEKVRDWMWSNRYDYNALSVMPHSEHKYVQTPFQTITADEYEALLAKLVPLDPTEIDESSDYTELVGEAACAGGACEVTWA